MTRSRQLRLVGWFIGITLAWLGGALSPRVAEGMGQPYGEIHPTWPSSPALASGQEDPKVRVTQPRVEYRFGEYIAFAVQVQPAGQVKKISVFFHPEQQPLTLVGEMALNADGSALYVHPWAQGGLPPFVTVYYWFRLTLQDGSTYTSPSFTLELEDNRFTWQHLRAPPFTVYWYAGDERLAQEVLNAAQQGLLRLQQQWQAPMPQEVAVYVYGGVEDFRSAWQGVPGWAAGHADPRLGQVYVSLPPGPEQGFEAQRQVPHELAHVLLYQALGTGYGNLPRWMEEGVASLAEAFPLPYYDIALQEAVQQRALLPLTSLCTAFPQQAGQATLAYAEARSFVTFLYERFGAQGLRNLLTAYAAGASCESAPLQALGEPLAALERQWRDTLAPSWLSHLSEWTPFLLLALLLVVPLALLSLLPRVQPPVSPYPEKET